MLNNKVVVVAEDEVNIRTMLAFLLKKCGYTVHVAGNGQEALDLVGQVHPQLVLTDLMMPVMNGCQLLEGLTALKGSPEYQGLRTVLMTANGSGNPLRQRAAPHADAVLSKPYEIEELLQLVDRYGGSQ